MSVLHISSHSFYSLLPSFCALLSFVAFGCSWWAFWVKVTNDSNTCSGWCSLLTVKSSVTMFIQHKYKRSWWFPTRELLIMKLHEFLFSLIIQTDPQSQSVNSKSSRLALAGVSFLSIAFLNIWISNHHTRCDCCPSRPCLYLATIHSFHGVFQSTHAAVEAPAAYDKWRGEVRLWACHLSFTGKKRLVLWWPTPALLWNSGKIRFGLASREHTQCSQAWLSNLWDLQKKQWQVSVFVHRGFRQWCSHPQNLDMRHGSKYVSRGFQGAFWLSCDVVQYKTHAPV